MKKFVVAILIALVSVAGMFAANFKLYAKKKFRLDQDAIATCKKTVQDVATEWEDNDIEVIFIQDGFIDEDTYEVVATKEFDEYFSFSVFSVLTYSPKHNIHVIVTKLMDLEGILEAIDLNEPEILAGRPKIDFKDYKKIFDKKF